MNYKNNKRGVVLPYVLIVGTFLMLLASGLFILSGSNLKLFRDGYQDRQAMLNTKSAVEYARAYLFTSEKQPKNFYVTSTLDEYNVATDFAVTEMNTDTPEALGKPDEHGAVKLASCVLTEDASAPATFKVDVQGRCISKNNGSDKERYEFLNYQSKFKLATQGIQTPDTTKPDPIMVTQPNAAVAKSIPATETRIEELNGAIGKADNSITDAEIAINKNMTQAINDINNAVSGEFKWVTSPVYTDDIPIDARTDGWIQEANDKAAKNPAYLVKIEHGGKVSNGGATTLKATNIVFVEPLMVDANFTITSKNVNFNKSFTVSDKVSCTITADYFSTGESGGAITCGDSSTLSINSENPAATTYFAQDATFGKDAKLLITTNWFRTVGKLNGNRSILNINSLSPETFLKGAWFDNQVNSFKILNIALPNGHVSFSHPVVLGEKDVSEAWSISARTAQLGSDPNADAVTFPTDSGSALTFGSEQKSAGTYVTINGNVNIQSHGTFNSYADKLMVVGSITANSAYIIAHPANLVTPSVVNFKSIYQDGGMLDIKSTSTFVAETLIVKKCMVDIIQHTDNSRLTIDGKVNLSNFCNVNINVITTVINGESSLDTGAKLTFNSGVAPYVKAPLTKVTFDKDVSIASQSKVIFNTTILQFNSSLTVQDSSTAFTVVPSSDSEINYVRAYGIITVNQKATIDIKSTYTAIHGNVAIMNSAKIGIKAHTPGDFKSAVLFVGLDDRNQEITTKIVQNNSILNISGDFVRFNGTYLSDGDTSAESQLDIKPVNDIASADVFPRENNVYMNNIDLKAPISKVNIKADYSDFTGNPYVETEYTAANPRPTTDIYRPADGNLLNLGANAQFTVSPRVVTANGTEPIPNSSAYIGNVNSADATKIIIKSDSTVFKGDFTALNTDLSLAQTSDYNSVFVCEGKFNYTNGKINMFAGENEHARAVKFAGETTLTNVTDFNINSQNILMENLLTFNGTTTNLGWNVTTQANSDPSQPPAYRELVELSKVVIHGDAQTFDASALDFLVLRGDIDKNFIIKHRPDELSTPLPGHILSVYCRPLMQNKTVIWTKGSPLRKVGYYQISDNASGDNILDDRTWYAKKTTGFPKVPPIPYEYTLPRDDAGNPIYPEPDDIAGGTVDIVFPAPPANNAGFETLHGSTFTQGQIDGFGNSSLWFSDSVDAQSGLVKIGTTTTDEKTGKVTFNTDTVVFDGVFRGKNLIINAKRVYFLHGANSGESNTTINAEYIYFGSPPGNTDADKVSTLGRATLGIYNDEDLDSQVYGVVFDTVLKPNGITIGATAKAPNTYIDFRKDISSNYKNGWIAIDGLHYACFKGKTSMLSTAKLTLTNTTNVEFRDDFDSDYTMKMDGANIVSFNDVFVHGNTDMSINSTNVVFNESVLRSAVDSGTGHAFGVYIAGLNDTPETTLHFTKGISRCFPEPTNPLHSYNKGGLVYNKGIGFNWLTDKSSTNSTINPPVLPDFPTTGKAVVEQEVFLK